MKRKESRREGEENGIKNEEGNRKERRERREGREEKKRKIKKNESIERRKRMGLDGMGWGKG